MNAIFNGKIIQDSQATLPLSDKAVWFDFGVYESIKVIKGRPFFPDKHISRFFHSAALINLHIGFSQQEILNWVNQLITAEKLDNALLRMSAFGDTEKNQQARIYIFALGLTFYPNTMYSQGAKAITYPGERFLPQSKNFNLLLNFLSYQKAKEQNAIEALLINKENFITEGTRSNVFIIKKNQCITPPEKDILNGVTRDLLLQWSTESTIKISEKQVTKKSLFEADEVFITSTNMNIMPIVKIDGIKISNGQVGHKTKELYLLFRKKQREYYSTT